jgi:hypothetical protein
LDGGEVEVLVGLGDDHMAVITAKNGTVTTDLS